MYNLSPRLAKLITATSENLAPNHYYLGEEKIIKKNGVPFLRRGSRTVEFSSKIYTDALYNVQKPGKRIIGGSSLRNKSARETKTPDDDTPGPTTYNPIPLTKKTRKIYKKEDYKGRRLYVCPVIYDLQARGPSIPTKIDENGYDFDEKRQLIKMPPNEEDNTLGPAYYCVQNRPCLTTRLYKGSTFWKSKVKRSAFNLSDTPSPGEYNVMVTKPLNERDEYVREMARLYSYVPRYLDAQEKRLLNENLPGPGTYTIREPKKESLSLNPAPFLKRSKRFVETNSNTPGADKYDIGSNIGKDRISHSDAPFNTNSLRFPEKKSKPTPGPGQYSVLSPLEENMLRKMCMNDNRIPFNRTEFRDMLGLNKDAVEAPSPFAYTVEKMELDKSNVDCSVFKSRTDRFQDRKKLKTAEPASYSVSAPFNKNRDRKSHNTGKVPFQSTQPSRVVPRPSSFYNPSPAHYNYVRGLSSKGFYFNTSPRFDPDVEGVPGPGTYMIHPSFDVSIYKATGTHNLRLKESVLRSKLRLPPNKTREIWEKENKKKKTLRAFFRPPPQKIKWMSFE